MKRIYLLSFVSVLALTFTGCSKVEVTDDGAVITDNKIITDDVTYVNDSSEVTVSRNNVTKTAQIEMNYKITDEEEFDDSFGEKMTTVPFTVNVSCSLFQAAIFDPESLEGLGAEQESEDEELDNALEGYTAKKLTINFIDAENGERIAGCVATGAGKENISYESIRSYEGIPSFFGAVIGEEG